MNIHTDPHNFTELAEEARALMAATADVTGEKVEEIRKRLSSLLSSGKKTFDRYEDRAIAGARAAAHAVCDHPYHSIGIAVGIGAIIGVILSSRR